MPNDKTAAGAAKDSLVDDHELLEMAKTAIRIANKLRAHAFERLAADTDALRYLSRPPLHPAERLVMDAMALVRTISPAGDSDMQDTRIYRAMVSLQEASDCLAQYVSAAHDWPHDWPQAMDSRPRTHERQDSWLSIGEAVAKALQGVGVGEPKA